ncbi:hypothetical protein [Cryobacterium sp. Y62]|uniref:hypothetical protein n=1 Tax=Cryobacterium sp. Y62 TaxID=2048284 RepID=UPI000CE4E6F2|nr:hypothetical protein [Cryobacterium sp. Y62]
MTTISYRPEVQRARTLRQRLSLNRLDYLRELRRLAAIMSQAELASQLGVKQPTIHSALRTAAKMADPVPGFSGASPYEITQRYATGELTRAQLVDELSRWAYPSEAPTGGFDPFLVTTSGSFDEVGRARSEGLIDGAIYDAILDRAVDSSQ